MDNLPAVIDAQWLQKWGAGPNAVAAFAEQWPDGCPITEDALVIARGAGVNIGWFAYSVLPLPVYAGFQNFQRITYADYIAKCKAVDAECKAVDAECQAKLDAAADECDAKLNALIIDLVLVFARKKQHGQNSRQTAGND